LNKADVIESLTARLGDKKVAAHAIDGFIDIIERAVAKGEKVSISGFGTFEKVARPARMARNPRTGEQVRTKKTNVAKFRPGSTLKSVASGETKKGREPKHTPLLPEGVTRMVSIVEGGSTPAQTTRAPRKAAASASASTETKATGSKAAPARKTASTRKSAASKTAPAKKTAAATTTPARSAASTRAASSSAGKATTGAKAAPARKTASTRKSAASKTAPAKKATTAKKTTARKTKATASK
jgi:DNA-binding protein HU-beta